MLRIIALLLAFVSVAACTNSELVKRSDHSQIYSLAMQRQMAYSVYTPPNWSAEESLPLMVLLHGARDDHETFDKYFVGKYLDSEINAGRLPRLIIVNPEGNLGFWENWHDGSRNYRDWVVNDLMPHIAHRYGTLPCPDHCYVSGISMGAHGAMRFAYFEPDTFNSVAAISTPIISKLHPSKPSIRNSIMKRLIPIKRIWGDIENETSHRPSDLDPYISWVKRERLFNKPLYLVWGSDDYDSIIKSNQHFQKFLSNNNKAHQWSIYQGGHNWAYWREVIGDAILFHTQTGGYNKDGGAPGLVGLDQTTSFD